ncbi:MAG TPA: Ig-like domain-containing protein [Longimicrobiaceae bacterium]|nr:Ig-like domain-containing protein [Longimicrobiaceae bacterium]
MALFSDFTAADTTPLTGSGALAAANGLPLLQIVGTAGSVQVSSNRASPTLAEENVMVGQITPASPDYDAEVTVYVSTHGARKPGACVRVQPDGSRYALFYDHFGGPRVSFIRYNGAAATNINNFAQSWALGSSHTLRLDVSGSGSTVTVTPYIDGVAYAGVGDTEADRITATGRPGIMFLGGGGLANGEQIDDFSTSAYAGGPPSNTAPTVSIDTPDAGDLAAFGVGGATLQLTATVTDAEDDPLPAPTWSSSAPGVATISSSGLVTAVSRGAVTITAEVEDSEGVPGDPATLELSVGSWVTYTIVALVDDAPSDASNSREVFIPYTPA